MKNKYSIIIMLAISFVYSHGSLHNHDFSNSFTRFTLGDINDDGVINIQDVILLINFILNDDYNNLADLNEDGTIDILDAVQVVNIILYGICLGERECLILFFILNSR